MKAILSKEGGGYDLYRIDEDGKRVTFASTQYYKQKLSLKNCQAIERGYDLDELVSVELEKLPYTKHLDDGQYNDGQLVGFELGAYWGFQKALELMGDKKFTEKDLDNAFELGKYVEREDCTENYLAYKQSLQQTEWDVEIELESVGRVKLGIGSKTEQMMPKLDAENCLILKCK